MENPALSQFEREIVSLVASGRTAAEIADQIAIPPRKVARHIEACKQKLGVKKNAELVARAMSSDLL